MLTQTQKYGIATMLATSSLSTTVASICVNARDDAMQTAAIRFAQDIDKHYKKRDGFVPQAVIRIVNA